MSEPRVDPELDQLLRAAAVEERETLRAALALGRAPTPHAAPNFGVPRAAQGARRRWTLLALAAAAGVLLFLVPRPREEAPAAVGSIQLGAWRIECLAPRGDVRAFLSFDWSTESHGAGWFDVLVHDPRATSGALPLTQASHLENSPWIPPENATRAWPDEIRWEVRAYDRSGAFLGSAAASARRSQSY